MVLGQECQHKVVKKSLPEEDKKEEKSSQPSINKLRKRSEFLDLRKNCYSFHGTAIIGNYKKSDNKISKIGLTVTKKIGNAVKRNYLKSSNLATASSIYLAVSMLRTLLSTKSRSKSK